MEQSKSKFCRICLVSGVKMYLLDLKCGDSLGFIYAQFTGIQIRNLSHYVCFECGALLRKFHLFKVKCLRAHRLLSRISRNPTSVTKELVDLHIDRKENELVSNLSRTETFCCEPTKNLDNLCKLEIEIKPGVLFSNNFGEGITQCEDFKEEFVKKELPDLCNNKLQKEYKLEEIKSICEKQNTENQSMLDVNTTLDDFDHDTVEYLDDDTVEYLEDDTVEYLDENILEKVEESVNNVTEYLEEHLPIEPKKSVLTYLNKKQVKEIKSVGTAKSRKRSKQKKKQEKEGTLKKYSVTKVVRKKSRQSLYKLRDNSIDWNLEFKGYGRVEKLTREEAKIEILKRKESKNYKTLPFKCELCFKGFERQYTFDNHMKTHKEETGKYECEFCHVRFHKLRNARGHERVTHLTKFYCLLCSFTSFNTERGRRHVMLHQGVTYPCTECDEVFLMLNSLIMHKRKKHLKKAGTEVVCELCGNIFATLSGLNMHCNRIHKTDKNSLQGPKCDECGVHFDSDKAWRRHLVLSSKHAEKPDSYICKECGEILQNESELRKHLQKVHIRSTYKDERRTYPFDCPKCNIKLYNQAEFEKHKMVFHSKSSNRVRRPRSVRGQSSGHYKPYVCEVCGWACVSLMQLTEHQRTHTGERPYQCDICDKRYKTKLVLNLHKKIHGSARHICDYCGRQFVLKHKLAAHVMRLHMGLRQHVCLICNKSFPYNCELRTHAKYVHENVPWPKRIRKQRVPKDNIIVTNETYELNNWYLN